MKINLKNKKTIIISALAIATILVAVASTITLPQKVSKLLGKNAEALLTQDYLEINRNNSPKFSVTYNDEKTQANVTIDYLQDATEKQYSIDGGRTWKKYEGEITLNQNVTIYARYKTSASTDYIIGSTKLIIDLKYNLQLQKPVVEMNTMNENSQIIEYIGNKVATSDVNIILSHPQEDDATIVYEAKISSYYIGTEGLVDSEGNVDESAVLEQADNDGGTFKKIGDYKTEEGFEVSENNKELTLKNTGIYKITLRATTNGGFVKSEEMSFVVVVDKLNRKDLVILKTADGQNYTSGTWTNQDVTAQINPEAQEAFAQFNEAVQNGTAHLIYTDNDGVETELDVEDFLANGKTYGEGKVKISFETRVGALKLTLQEFDICIDKTAPEIPEVYIKGGDVIEVEETDGTITTYYTGETGLKTYRTANGTTYPTDGYYEVPNSIRILVNKGEDNLSGVDELKFINDKNELVMMPTDHYEKADNSEYSGKSYEYSATVRATSTLSRDMTIYSYDKAGNVSTYTITIKVDKTAPTVTINIKGGEQINGYYQGEYNITQIVDGVPRDNSKVKKVQAYLTWSDNGVGIDDSLTELWVDGEKRDSVPHDLGSDMPPAITMGISGTRTIKYVVYDKAGNSTTVSKTVNICLAHSGGTATCTTWARCERCNVGYGSLASHTESATWTTDGTNHWKVCSTCGTIVVDKTAHSGGTSWYQGTTTHYKVCSTCGKGYNYVSHSSYRYEKYNQLYHKQICGVCGKTDIVSHNFNSLGVCTNCDENKSV